MLCDGVQYIDLVSLAHLQAARANDPHLDLSRAPYVLDGVKCIDLVSLAPVSVQIRRQSVSRRAHVGGWSISNSNLAPLFVKWLASKIWI